MRIIRGTHQRRQIVAPSNLPVRPTTDMAKESLFNILENHLYFEDVTALDLLPVQATYHTNWHPEAVKE